MSSSDTTSSAATATAGWAASRASRKLAVQSLFVDHLRTITSAGLSKKDAMVTLARHLEAGELTPVIDRTYPLEEAAAALHHLMDGEALGRVVLTT